jgi:catechol 2,3-dioxygenase
MIESTHPQLTHMGITVRNLVLMEKFYTNVLSLTVTDRGRGKNFKRDIVFMTADPSEHHQIVLASGRGPNDPSSVFQMSFKVRSIDALRAVKNRAIENGATNMMPMNHGNALSVYFSDPEENLVEVYRDTPFYVPQPYGDHLDLTLSDDDIWKQTEERCRKDPGFKPVAEFVAATATRLRG